jgi:hypothetical protein
MLNRKSSILFTAIVSTFCCCNSPKKNQGGAVLLNTGLTIEITKLSPPVLKAGAKMKIDFTFTNGTPGITNGFIGVSASYYDATFSGNNLPVINMAAHTSIKGSMEITVPDICDDYKVFLTYYIPITKKGNGKKNGQTTRTVRAPQCSDSSLFGFHPQLTDEDHDMLDDNIEKHLLEKFRPFLKFSSGDDGPEDFRPTDVLFYVRNSGLCEDIPGWDDSQLSIEPRNLLLISGRGKPSSDLRKKLTKTDYHLSPNDEGRHGNTWREIHINNSIGLYGHVVPLMLNNATDYVRQSQYKGCPASGKLFYKIEYWQFFGFNNEEQIGGVGNHEGDWGTVQLLVDAETEKISMVFHYAHGTEIRFNMSAALTDVLTTDQHGLTVREFKR